MQQPPTIDLCPKLVQLRGDKVVFTVDVQLYFLSQFFYSKTGYNIPLYTAYLDAVKLFYSSTYKRGQHVKAFTGTLDK